MERCGEGDLDLTAHSALDDIWKTSFFGCKMINLVKLIMHASLKHLFYRPLIRFPTEISDAQSCKNINKSIVCVLKNLTINQDQSFRFA